MPLQILTTQISKWRLCRDHKIFFLDTTVKSGYSLFAPTWDMVMAHKASIMSDEEYSHLYRKILINSWMSRREEWMKFLQTPEPVALACFCKAGKFCHRLLLKDFLQQLCKQLNIPFEYFGELTDTPPETKPDDQTADARREPTESPDARSDVPSGQPDISPDSPRSDCVAVRPDTGTRPGPIELDTTDVLPF